MGGVYINDHVGVFRLTFGELSCCREQQSMSVLQSRMRCGIFFFIIVVGDIRCKGDASKSIPGLSDKQPRLLACQCLRGDRGRGVPPSMSLVCPRLGVVTRGKYELVSRSTPG